MLICLLSNIPTLKHSFTKKTVTQEACSLFFQENVQVFSRFWLQIQLAVLQNDQLLLSYINVLQHMSIFQIQLQKYTHTKKTKINLFSPELELNMIQETSCQLKSERNFENDPPQVEEFYSPIFLGGEHCICYNKTTCISMSQLHVEVQRQG